MPFSVAPFTGAWIEIKLKYFIKECEVVAPFTGAWIEITSAACATSPSRGRTLHGCVD